MPISDAEAYHFSVRFRLPTHQCIYSEDGLVSLDGIAGEDRLELRPTDTTVLKDARYLVLSGFGYVDEAAAAAAYKQAQKALTLAVLESSCGIELFRDNFDVWRGVMAIGRVGAEGYAVGVTGVGADMFRARLTRWLADDRDLTDDQSICINLLMDYHFDLNIRSRSLLAHAVIERLCNTPIEKDAPYLEAIDSLREAAKRLAIDPTMRKLLKSDLDKLRFIGQTERIRRTIAQKLGDDRATQYSAAANMRHKIAHHGLKAGDISWTFCSIASDLLFDSLN